MHATFAYSVMKAPQIQLAGNEEILTIKTVPILYYSLSRTQTYNKHRPLKLFLAIIS